VVAALAGQGVDACAALDGGIDVLLHATADGGPWAPARASTGRPSDRAGPDPQAVRWMLTQKGRSTAEVEEFMRVAVEQLRAFADAWGGVLFGTDVARVRRVRRRETRGRQGPYGRRRPR
jgi:hypothetical protein